MKYFFVLCLSVFIVYGCAKKNVPSAPATPSTETTKAPDEIKIVQVDPKNSPAALAGMETYNAKCGRCHGLKNTVDYTKEEWVPIMGRMAKKARLDSMETVNVNAYVQTHAKGV